MGKDHISILKDRCDKLRIAIPKCILNSNFNTVLSRSEHEKFYDSLLNNKDYRLLPIKESKNIAEELNIKNSQNGLVLIYRNDIYFSIDDLINDIYNFFSKYYEECNNVMHYKYSDKIQKFQELLVQLKQPTECLNRYNCQIYKS